MTKRNYDRTLLKTKQVITMRSDLYVLSNKMETTMHKVISQKEVTKLQLRG